MQILQLTSSKFAPATSYFRLFIKPGIKKRGTECGKCRELGECSLGFRAMFLYLYSGECSRRFRVVFKRIPGNVQEDFGECFQFYVNESYVLLRKSKCYLNFEDVIYLLMLYRMKQ